MHGTYGRIQSLDAWSFGGLRNRHLTATYAACVRVPIMLMSCQHVNQSVMSRCLQS